MSDTEKATLSAEPMTQSTPTPILAFFTGSAISYVGDMLTLLAVPWFVLQTTGSVTRTGITAFFATLPAVLSALFGSVLVDRLGYKRTSVIGDIASGVTVLFIPLLYHTVGLAFWQLLGLVFVGGILKSPGVTARSAMVPELAALARMRLERANALSDGISRMSGLIGAPLAGVLIVVIGTSNLLWFDAASFFISALLFGLAVPGSAMASHPLTHKQSYLASLREGMRFIGRDTFILSVLLVILLTNLIDAAFFAVILPAFVREHFRSAIPLGVLVASLGGAGFVGTLIFGAIGHRLPRRLTFGIGYTVGGALRFWVYLFFPVLPVMVAWNIIAGLAIAPINPLLDTIFQVRLPVAMRTRVLGTIGAGTLAGIPLGTFVSGYVVTWMGMPATLFTMGALYLAATLSLLANPAMQEMEKR
jgi:MFS family permease